MGRLCYNKQNTLHIVLRSVHGAYIHRYIIYTPDTHAPDRDTCTTQTRYTTTPHTCTHRTHTTPDAHPHTYTHTKHQIQHTQHTYTPRTCVVVVVLVRFGPVGSRSGLGSVWWGLGPMGSLLYYNLGVHPQLTNHMVPNTKCNFRH